MGQPQAKTRVTFDEYLRLEQASSERHQLIDGELYAMAGSTRTHNALAGALFAALRSHLKGKRCTSYISDVKVHVIATGDCFYPDVVVTCDERDLGPGGDALVVRYPSLLIEVLSPSTEAYDRGEKFRVYRLLETLQEYVLVDWGAQRVEVFRRDPDGGWRFYPSEPGEMATFESVGLAVDVREVYEGTEVPLFRPRLAETAGS